jgi:hypothetical protein
LLPESSIHAAWLTFLRFLLQQNQIDTITHHVARKRSEPEAAENSNRPENARQTAKRRDTKPKTERTQENEN